MKITAFALMSLTAFLCATAHASANSDTADLAFGYAAAFQCMSKSTVSVAYANSTGVEIIKDVKEMKSFGGVLLIKIYGGDQQILDAGKVLKITEK